MTKEWAGESPKPPVMDWKEAVSEVAVPVVEAAIPELVVVEQAIDIATDLIKMVRDPEAYPEPHTADVHPAEDLVPWMHAGWTKV